MICSFINTTNLQTSDIEIPLEITCDEFVKSMNESMQLNIEIPSNQAYFRSENPIALIQGDKLLGELLERSAKNSVSFNNFRYN